MRISKCIKKFLFATVLTSISTVSWADWDVQRVYVKKVEQVHSGASVARVIYEVVPGSVKANFGCAPNDTEVSGLPNHYQASFWSSGVSALHQIYVGQLLAAQAQNFPVDLFFDASGCNTTASYGHGGLGRKMIGVSVSLD